MRTPAWQLLALLTLVSPPDRATSAGCDVSTEEGALAVYQELTGREGTPGCIDIRREFAGLAYVGSVVPDAGCRATIMIWQCRKAGDADVPAILQAAGWSAGDDVRRMKIARDWLSESVLWDDTKDVRQTFADAGKFYSPATMTARNGAVRVEGWRMENGMTIAGPYRKYSRFTVDFAPEGRVVQSVGESFVPYGRHSADLDRNQ